MYHLGKQLANEWTGLLISGLFLLDPNMIAHNHYVTTDVGGAIFMFLSMYYFVVFLKENSLRSAIVFGLIVALAMSSKHSSLLLVIYLSTFFVVYLVIRIVQRNSYSAFLLVKKSIINYLIAISISIVFIWALYIITGYDMDAGKISTDSINYFSKNTEKIYDIGNGAISILDQKFITRPFATHAFGIFKTYKTVSEGKYFYFMGEMVDSKSENILKLYYFPFLFIAKQTVVHLFIYSIALISVLFYLLLITNKLVVKKSRHNWKLVMIFFDNHLFECVLILFVVFYSYQSMNSTLFIGFRHIFPILPPIYVLSALTLWKISLRMLPKIYHIKQWAFFVTMMVSMLVIIVVNAYPHYLAYHNIFFGGTERGYEYVADSNVDWGQDLVRLRSYLDIHPEIDNIHVDYMGPHFRSYAGKDSKLIILKKELGDSESRSVIPWWGSRRPVENGYYALSVHYFQRSMYKAGSNKSNSYKIFDENDLVDRVGSFLIYKINDEL